MIFIQGNGRSPFSPVILASGRLLVQRLGSGIFGSEFKTFRLRRDDGLSHTRGAVNLDPLPLAFSRDEL
jgi:hypothetical protein